MQKNRLSLLSTLWICNLLLLAIYTIGSPSLHFLKSSVLEYGNIASDPFDGAVYPIAYVPDWSKIENTNKSRSFESFDISAFMEIPEYDTDTLSDDTQKITKSILARYTYPVVYMGSYRGNYTEYDGSHGAVDIRAPIGTPVVSIANGVIVRVKNTESGDGKYVVIRHDDVERNGVKETLYSGYEHLSEIVAVEGTKIRRGEVLGKVGMTGITTTPHLHFQIDKSISPFHMYWPYTFKQASDLGLDFFAAINVGLGKENAIRYTIHPMEFIKENRSFSSAPKEVSIAAETKKDPIVLSSEMVALVTAPVTENTVTVPTPEETTMPETIVVETVPEVAVPETVVPEVIVSETVVEVLVPEKVAEITNDIPAFTPNTRFLFSDISENSPFYEATKYLYEAGVTYGYDDGGFHPNDRISRSETILLYDRLFDNTVSIANVKLPFVDVLPSGELSQALARAFAQKIVANRRYFRPNDSLSRAEAITLLIRTSGIPLATEQYSLFQDVKINNSHRIYINTFAKYLGIKGNNFEPDKSITRGELAKILYAFDQKQKKESK